MSSVALGHEPASLVLKQATIINVFDRSTEVADIAIEDGMIVGVGTYHGKTEIDCTNRFVSPGFIDGHVHIESSMLTPPEFSKLILPKGTTSIIADPHEIVNVCGKEGLNFMIQAAKQTPLDIHFMVPSCVPATQYETSGATIDSADIVAVKDWDKVLGLGEVMDYPSVIHGEEDMIQKIKAMDGRVIDGHAPDIYGKDLNAYLLHGIMTDHECTNVNELKEKLKRGMYIHLREGSATRNVVALLPGVTTENVHRTLFCTDDKHPMDIEHEGHINYNINLSIEHGLDPLMAIQMATINAATLYRLPHIGAIAPGYKANLVVFDDLYNVQADLVFVNGDLIARQNQLLIDIVNTSSETVLNTVHVPCEMDFTLPLKHNRVKVIQVVENNVITKQVEREVSIENGHYVNNPTEDIIKIAIVERHHNTGNIGLGLLEGYGLKQGAIAMTIAHDSHNIVVVGDNDLDMEFAVKALESMQGGIVIVRDQQVVDSITLEVAGLMTNQPYYEVSKKLIQMESRARTMGVNDTVDDPFVTLSFMGLPVIPDLVVTDRGLFDVLQFKHVKIEVDES
jgi:adenine deaminase